MEVISETRLANESKLTESGAGYTFYWIGKSDSQPRHAGVGFAIKTSLTGHLVGLPQGVKDRLISIRFRLSKHHHATIINACAPTMTYPNEVKEESTKSYQGL